MAKDVDIKGQAAGIIDQELAAWESPQAFITDKVSFNIRNLIKRLRKNYWGVFDEPFDESTGREKTWVPLTESTVNAVVKNCDLDSKDINFRAKNVKAVGVTAIIRNAVRDRLDEIYFGEYLDELVLRLAIDGTVVWKTLEQKGPKGPKFVIRPVDLLNFYIDPTARSIAEATAVIERAVLTQEEFMAMDGWDDKEEVAAVANVPQNDRYASVDRGASKFVEVFERWGLMPKSLLTGNGDDEEMVEGHIVVSGRGKGAKVHLIEANKKQDAQGQPLRPYEEAWFVRVPGRWYGKGPAESLLMLQTWVNIIVNIRITRSFISQLGIFKVRRGAGITPQMMSRLAANGAVQVGDMNDIEQMVMQEASQASYADEDRIQSWSERVTNAFEVVTGEAMPSSTPATNAVLQARGAASAFTRVKEGVGLFLERWLSRQALPIMLKNLKAEDVIRVSGEPDELEDLAERVASEMVYREMSKMNDAGRFIDPLSAVSEIDRVKQVLLTRGRELFVKLKEKLDLNDFDVKVDVTAESVDKGVLAQNLVSVFQTAATVPQAGVDPVAVLKQLWDLMGLDARQISTKTPMLPPGMMGQMPMPGAVPPGAIGMPTEQNTVTGANLPAL